MLVSYRPGVVTLGCLLLCLGGCGSNNNKTATVSGTVTYEGKNLVYGTVTMVGEDSVSRSGAIQKDGKFTVEGVPFGQVRVAVHSRDPASQRNYYRWTATGYVPRKSYGFTYPPNASPCPDPFSCLYLSECEELLPNYQINVLSDQLINGNEIVLPVFYSPIYWFGNHFVQVNQYSLNQDLYVFWQQYLQQTNLTGSILDPLPASLVGNIYNPADANDLALGYFEASDMASKKIIIIPYFLQEYYLESVAGEYILKGDCDLVYPGAVQDNTAPAGWETADTISIH